jgi:ferredoxin
LFELQEIEGKKIAIFSGDPEECVGCESCVTICPSEAITMTEE